jgi:hypothetical protein
MQYALHPQRALRVQRNREPYVNEFCSAVAARFKYLNELCSADAARAASAAQVAAQMQRALRVQYRCSADAARAAGAVRAAPAARAAGAAQMQRNCSPYANEFCSAVAARFNYLNEICSADAARAAAVVLAYSYLRCNCAASALQLRC